MTDTVRADGVIQAGRALEGDVLALAAPSNERLRQLAHTINAAHAGCERVWAETVQATRRTLEQAFVAGEALNAAKAEVGHGNWLLWLGENCPDVKRTQAANYMKLAKAAASGQLPDITADGNLSIDKALRLISGPKRAREAITDATDAPSGGGSDDEGDGYTTPLTMLDAALNDVRDKTYRGWGAGRRRASDWRDALDALPDEEYGPVTRELDAHFEAYQKARAVS